MASDVLGIVAYWSEKQGQNAFGIRGIGARYDALWSWLNGPKSTARGIEDDFPWAYIVFDDPFQEQQFTSIYADTIWHEEGSGYKLLAPNQLPKGFVPYAQRIPGKSYLEKCGHYHVWDPKPEGWTLEGEMLEQLSKSIAEEIDAQVLADLLAQFGVPGQHKTETPIGIPSPPLRAIRAIIEQDQYIELGVPEGIAIWNKINGIIEPYYTTNSLHVYESWYELDGQKYAMFWEMGQDSDFPSVSRIVEYKRVQ